MDKTLRTKIRIQAALSPAIRQAALQIKMQIQIPERKEEMEMQEKDQSFHAFPFFYIQIAADTSTF